MSLVAPFYTDTVYIDEHLSWDKHIHEVACKVSSNVGILGKLKHTARHIFVNLKIINLLSKHEVFTSSSKEYLSTDL